MITKTKTALIAAFVLGSASAALAQAAGEEFQNSQYQLNPAAPVPLFAQQVQQPRALIEGRNVGIERNSTVPTQVDRLQSFGGY